MCEGHRTVLTQTEEVIVSITPSRTTIISCVILACILLGPAPIASGAEPAASFHVEVHGAGLPILLIPGLSCSGDVWDETVAALAGNYEVHVLSLAGFAGRAAIAAPFLPRVRDDIVAYIQAQQLHRPAIVGHSLGGFLAFWLAASEPTLVGPIVAVDGVPFLPALMDASTTVDSVRTMAEGTKTMMASLSPEQFARQTRMSIATMVTAPEDPERLARQGGESDPTTVAQAMFELMTTDLRDDVANIESPVLLLAAGAAALTPEARAGLRRSYEAQVAPIPDHRVLVADDARHFIMLDAPDFFHATLIEFLTNAAGHKGAR